MAYDPEYQKLWYEKNKVAHKAKAAANNVLYRQRNREYIASAKDRPCEDCGKEYPPYVMQFDHIGSDKEFNVSQAGTMGLAKLQREIDKCEVVCANCHAERTYTRRHGIIG